MKTKTTFLVLASALMLASGCKTHYEVTTITRSRILVDSRYDAQPDQQALAFLQPYRQKVDSVMGPVVGRSTHYMTAQRPEGDLSNLLADILVWGAKNYNEKPDFGVYNMGGVRADLPKGDVTYGDVLDIAPFENKIAFGTLSGAEVLQLFSEMASVGGEGVSHSVRMVITNDGKLVSATINGEAIDPQKDYRVTTIDYLLGGTDKLETFRKCRDINSPQEASNNSRFIIMDYFREQTRLGREVDSQIEGRITVSDLNNK
jgi:2',3'-cyclic-nucleotide 2'-phosphodiesterase (5'-nucleotidase family)